MAYKRFKQFLRFVCPTLDNEDVIYWCKNELLLTLMKLRSGAKNLDLAERFNISNSTVSNKIITWINLLYVALGTLNIWPHRDIIIQKSPKEFQEKCKDTVIIIDATELTVQVPSSIQKQSELGLHGKPSECYSNYKHHTTLKSLIGVDPMGGVMFVSQLFEGSISDKEIVKRSGFLTVLNMKLECGEILPGDGIMADRGFNIGEDLQELALKINVPPFLRENG
ncbi:uncharacterized protein [Apostichopus japonicus]|uniref:uncharacterized protein n=1 Tax=Stichopus japonicus TaxID=307972 RepID=UPI003AB91345